MSCQSNPQSQVFILNCQLCSPVKVDEVDDLASSKKAGPETCFVLWNISIVAAWSGAEWGHFVSFPLFWLSIWVMSSSLPRLVSCLLSRTKLYLRRESSHYRYDKSHAILTPPRQSLIWPANIIYPLSPVSLTFLKLEKDSGSHPHLASDKTEERNSPLCLLELNPVL